MTRHTKIDHVEVVERALGTLRGRTYRAPTEDALQRTVAELLDAAGLRVKREVRLSDRDRVDIAIELPPPRPVLEAFSPVGAPAPVELVTLPGGQLVVVELKLEAPTATVVRQLRRYATCDRVAAVILATTSSRLIALVPRAELGGKPLYTAHLRRF